MNHHYLANLISVVFKQNSLWFPNTCKILLIIKKNNLEILSLEINLIP